MSWRDLWRLVLSWRWIGRVGGTSQIIVGMVAGGSWGVRDLLKGQSLAVRLPTQLCIFGDLQVKARCVIHQARRIGFLRDSGY